MAERRMFTKKITESDAFLEMPLSTQCLYFHLNMAADDEGFVNSPRRIQKMVGASDDDLKLLMAKAFILTFESGVIVIKHWKMHNYIQSDRFHPTDYKDERALLSVKDNKSYTLDTECIQDGYKLDTEVRLGKDSIGKVNKERHQHGEYNNVLLTDDDFEKLKSEFPADYQERIDNLSAYMKSKGVSYKDHLATIRNWARMDKKRQQQRQTNNKFNQMEKTDYDFDALEKLLEGE